MLKNTLSLETISSLKTSKRKVTPLDLFRVISAIHRKNATTQGKIGERLKLISAEFNDTNDKQLRYK